MRCASSWLLLVLGLFVAQLAFISGEVQVGDEELPTGSVIRDDNHPSVAHAAQVLFFESNSTTAPLACGGVQIARDYVLTSASCVQAHQVTTVSTRTGARRRVTKHIVHPRFDLTSDAQFDIAILVATSDANETTPSCVLLDSRTVADFERLDRLSLDAEAKLEAVTALPATQCVVSHQRNQPATSTEETVDSLPLPTQCIQPASKQRASVAAANAILFRRSALDETHVYLAGLQPVLSSQDRLFVSIPAAANFINAYSAGHTWGTAPDTPLVSSKTPWSSEATSALVGAARTTSRAYVVGLRAEKNGQNFCSGSLIAPTFVLTTANCVSDGLAAYAALGSGAAVEVIRVVQNRTRTHPSFGVPNKASFNAAVLELEFAAYAGPIEVGSAADFADKTHAIMTSPTASVGVPVWSMHSCEATLPNVDGSILCAGGEAGQDACAGDAGSPLTIQDRDGKEQLIGIVSAGYGCGRPGVPGLYTRVASVRDFVRANTVATKVSSPTNSPSAISVESGADRVATEAISTASAVPITTSANADNVAAGGSSAATPVTAMRTRLSKLSPMTHGKVVEILVHGSTSSSSNDVEFEDQFMPLFAQDAVSLELFSTGNLDALTAVVANHDALPLNQRVDRFASRSTSNGRIEETPSQQICTKHLL